MACQLNKFPLQRMHAAEPAGKNGKALIALCNQGLELLPLLRRKLALRSQ
jgi:hypothetical protein